MASKYGDLAILGEIGRESGRASQNREITIFYGVDLACMILHVSLLHFRGISEFFILRKSTRIPE